MRSNKAHGERRCQIGAGSALYELPPLPLSTMTPSSSAWTRDGRDHNDADAGDETESAGGHVSKGIELRRLHHGRKDSADTSSEVSSDDDSASSGRPSTPPRIHRTDTLSKDFTPEEEVQVLRKLDRRLTLFLALLYLLSFLDRSNIGNARIAGLDTSLSLSSSQYDWLLTAFYITYIGFEWMILLYKLLPAHAYISLCVLCWGLVASLQSVVTSFPQLLVLRACLGITEAAFGPGVPFYMTFFYKRHELAYRVGLQISAAPLATSFASSLAWLIVWVTGKVGVIESWRALFLIEGFPSVLVAVWAWWWIPDSPATTRWLSPRERRVATLRMQEERDKLASVSEVRGTTTTTPTTKKHRGVDGKEILQTLTDPKSYMTALMFFSVNVSFASLPVFLPTIINSMAFSPLASQALAAPPYLCAFLFVLVIGYYSDKTPHSRGIFTVGVASLSSASYALIAVAGALEARIGVFASVTIRYIAVYGAAMGLFSAVTLIITWTLNNQQSSTGKGTGMVVLNVVGQCGPLVGVHLFPKSQEPHYVAGMAVCAGFMGGVAVLAVALRVYLGRLNGTGTAEGGRGVYEMVGVGKDEDGGEGEGMLRGDGRGKGDARFMYML